jgi:hypothetical protein
MRGRHIKDSAALTPAQAAVTVEAEKKKEAEKQAVFMYDKENTFGQKSSP